MTTYLLEGTVQTLPALLPKATLLEAQQPRPLLLHGASAMATEHTSSDALPLRGDGARLPSQASSTPLPDR